MELEQPLEEETSESSDTPTEPFGTAPSSEDERSEGESTESEIPDGELEKGAADGTPPPQLDLGLLEAMLMATEHPLTPARLGEIMKSGVKAVRQGIKALNQQYIDTGRSFRIEQVAGGYQILTLPAYGQALQVLHQREIDARLTKAAMETLAIIAYKQPILRADVEAIRGVACGETIRSLMEKHLVRIAGRAEVPGRPILYGTTKRFLELFGLNSLSDLPSPDSATGLAAR